MESPSSALNKKTVVCLALTLVVAVFVLSGCLSSQQPPEFGPSKTYSSNEYSTSGTSGNLESYTSAKSTKIIFNKKSFYTNYSTNTSGCAGDAKYYYGMLNDRIVPIRPDWLKNVSVDITNSNAFYGPSKAAGCSLSGASSPAANCATFDDLQPLTGEQSRSILIGGTGCSNPSSGCSATSVLGDIWSLSVDDVATNIVWTPNFSNLPTPSTTTLPGFTWFAGDFDEIHNQFYLFGGASYNTTTGFQDFSSSIAVVYFSSDGTVSTSPIPYFASPRTSSVYYGNWTQSAFTAGLTTPSPMVGSNFTHAIRRDPTYKSWCPQGDANCSSNSLSANSAVANNEHNDYLLLTGGMKDTNVLSSEIYMYKPHGFSNDVGTNAPSGGDWTLLSNNVSAGVRATIMTVADISTAAGLEYTYQATSVGSSLPDGSGTFSGWLGRAFHRTVYDPTMNRFYIFGGITADTATNVTTTTPDVSSELWIYDPPALGRRPTSICNVSTTPDDQTLPSTILSTRYELGPNLNYLTNSTVFPPGGCLQRVNLRHSKPDARFEHAMALDKDQKAIVVFGGCNTASTITASGTTLGGDPTTNCTTSSTLLNDTWMYVPPTTTEVLPKDYLSTNIPNIFGTDFWLEHLFLYQNNSPDYDVLYTPQENQVMGAWIKLSPTSYPTKRYSAAMSYDKAHHKFYLFGGYGCTDSTCISIKALNDLWEYTPPNLSDCSLTSLTCNSSGTWTKIRASNDTLTSQPTIRKSAIMAYAQPMFSFGDDYYTVNDSSCISQGPTSSFDSSVNKRYVGAIYIDLDRGYFDSKENLLINLKLLPFDEYTKLPTYSDNDTYYNTSDDTDRNATNDIAVIRVQFLNSPFRYADQIQSLIQPRFHEFISGTPVLADTFVYVSGSSGQISEKQILVPLQTDSSINLIKIERVQGSVKFYEMSLSKF